MSQSVVCCCTPRPTLATKASSCAPYCAPYSPDPYPFMRCRIDLFQGCASHVHTRTKECRVQHHTLCSCHPSMSLSDYLQRSERWCRLPNCGPGPLPHQPSDFALHTGRAAVECNFISPPSFFSEICASKNIPRIQHKSRIQLAIMMILMTRKKPFHSDRSLR